MAPPLPLEIRSPVLNAQAEKFLVQANRLRDAVKEGEQVLTALKQKGLGRDNTSRNFSEEFWKQQAKVVEAIGKAVAVLVGVHSGLYGVARVLPGADEATAQLFKKLMSPADGLPANVSVPVPEYLQRIKR